MEAIDNDFCEQTLFNHLTVCLYSAFVYMLT